jgi:hypothetical protein
MIKMIRTILGACFYILIIASALCILTYLVQDLVIFYTAPVEGNLPILIRISNYLLSFPVIGTFTGSLLNLFQQI